MSKERMTELTMQVLETNLNRELQELLNPSGEEVTGMGRSFRVNDKVMQLQNNYGKEVFNGDIGR
jgi:exodeoxyribonuclease V alpha subunit